MKEFLRLKAIWVVNYPVIIPCFLASVMGIVLYFYLNCQDKKRHLKTTPAQIVFKLKKQSRNIPTITYWFPFAIPLFDGILTLLQVRLNGVEFLNKCQNRFENVFWVPVGHKKYFVMNDVNMIQKLLSSSNPQHLDKPEIYDKAFDLLRDGLLNSNFPVWSIHRKMLSRCFTYNCLQTYLVPINKHGKDLVRSLSNFACKTDEIDTITDTSLIDKTIHYHLVKIIADIVMGTSSLSDGTAAEFANHFRFLKQSLLEKLLNPLLGTTLFRSFNLKAKNYYDAFNYMEVFFKMITNKYRTEYEHECKVAEKLNQDGVDDCKEIKTYRCLIQEMLYQGATNGEITSQVSTFLATGHETLHVALEMLMFHMALNPIHQSRCRDEVDQLINHKMPTAKQSPQQDLNGLNFSIHDLANMKYLERCVLESLRITPTVPIFFRKLDSTLKISNDIELHPGTNIAVPVWTIHRAPENFPNPEKFDPERFIPENAKLRHPFSFIPFSSGPRNCIGYKLALMEIKVIMAWILRHFEIYSNDKLRDVKLLFDATLKPERNYSIILKRRQL